MKSAKRLQLVCSALYELARLWRTRSRDLGPIKRLLAPQYRLSTTAMIMGVAQLIESEYAHE